MDQKDILRTALEQSAIDYGCTAEDFFRCEPVAVQSIPHPDARKYLTLPFACSLCSYGNNVVASTSGELQESVLAFLKKYPPEHCFETPNMYALNEILQSHGLKVCFMAEYFLPELDLLQPLTCPYELRLLTQKDFSDLYLPEWSNALCEKRKHLDVLAVGAYDRDKLIGLAGCSKDCDTMWQIGVDVLPAYRKQGVAAAVTSHLALEIIRHGKVPFYCAAWSNIKSVRNALKCGFRPAWVEITAKSIEYVNSINDEGTH
ncbi:MAG: GNAT family N-acetyltransferase [Clostridia bacterium]|nr:GNAT family N-acetyltransferase [Clostridia bacterium]